MKSEIGLWIDHGSYQGSHKVPLQIYSIMQL